MNRKSVVFAVAVLAVCCAASSAQTASPPVPFQAPAKQPEKQIDIGAAQAPLTELERTDLDKAVKKHDYPAEKGVIDKAMAEHPNSFELLVMAGRLAYLEKQPKNAVEAFQRADKIKPLSEEDRMTLAIADEFSGQAAQAREELLKLTKLAPKNAQYWYLLGRMDRQNQRLEMAADDLSKTIRLDPNFVRAYEDLGQCQEDLGHLDEAKKTYEAGAAVNRKLSSPWEWSPLDLGVLALKENEYPAAEKLFQEALQYRPRFAWGHYYLGQLREKQDRAADATQEYKEAVVDDPRLRQAWLALSREFTRQGDKVEADRCLVIFKKLEAQQNAIKGRKN